LSACGQDEPLTGQRVDLRAPTTTAAATRVAAFSVPPVTRNTNWTHRAGSAGNTPIHPAFAATPQLVWSTRIGAKEGRRHRISADPVVANGRIFTLDSRATVTAVSATGEVLWSSNLTPASDADRDASGGGLATDGPRLYVTTGFGRIFALSAASGGVIWEQRLNAAATAAPTVSGGKVYVVGTDSRAWALEADTGRIAWQISGTPSPSGYVGGSAPAVTDQLALLPFPSSELVGVFKLSGLQVWAAPISGQRRGRVYARITDVTGDPVVAGGTVYVGNPSGRTVALELSSGERLWTVDEGALSPVQVAGGSVFLTSDQNQLIRLDARTGQRVWALNLPYYTKVRQRRRNEITDHYGPLLAGGRLVVASGDGYLRFFDPGNGAPLGELELPGGAAALPAIAGGTLYAVSASGHLHAFR